MLGLKIVQHAGHALLREATADLARLHAGAYGPVIHCKIDAIPGRWGHSDEWKKMRPGLAGDEAKDKWAAFPFAHQHGLETGLTVQAIPGISVAAP